tara:strand:+ start:125 stop:1210 length:1086 start_codon:yes stop_codon:yes gene_type:complete
MDCNTVRVFSSDGGGIRGLIPIEVLNRISNQLKMPSNEFWKIADVFCGTSVGGIIMLALAIGKGVEDIKPLFSEKGKKMFTVRSIAEVAFGSCTTTTENNRENTLEKIVEIINNDPFYDPHCPWYTDAPGDSNYGVNVLHKTLVEIFGDMTMQDVKTNVLIPAYEEDTETFRLFSNVNNSAFIGQNEKIVNVAMATSAAPIYFPSVQFNDHTYIDGGIFQNNPSELGLSLAQSLKKGSNRFCVLSLGTGIGKMGFDQGAAIMAKRGSAYHDTNSSITKLVKLADEAMTGGQESVHQNLQYRASNTLENLYYYRFQPKLDPNQNTDLDNADPEFLQYMLDIANQYYNDDIANITTFLEHLTA